MFCLVKMKHEATLEMIKNESCLWNFNMVYALS